MLSILSEFIISSTLIILPDRVTKGTNGVYAFRSLESVDDAGRGDRRIPS